MITKVNEARLYCFFLKMFYWNIVNLQYCVSFRCAAKWVSYTYAYPVFFVKPCSDIWRQHFWLLCYSSFFFFLIFLHKIVLAWVWCLRPLGHPDSLQNCIKSDFIDIPVQILSRACKDIHICTKKLLTLHDLSRQKFKFFHESGSWKLKEFYCIIWEIWSG